jgi:hypothetical protein
VSGSTYKFCFRTVFICRPRQKYLIFKLLSFLNCGPVGLDFGICADVCPTERTFALMCVFFFRQAVVY